MHKRRCRRSRHTENNFSHAISSNSTSIMKNRYSQAHPARVPATTDRRYQAIQQLQDPQAQAGGCACPVPVERSSRGRAQDSVSRSNSAVPEQKWEIGFSSSGKVNVDFTLSTFDCLSTSRLISARSRPVALSTKVPVAPSSSSSLRRYPSSYAFSLRDSDNNLS